MSDRQRQDRVFGTIIGMPLLLFASHVSPAEPGDTALPPVPDVRSDRLVHVTPGLPAAAVDFGPNMDADLRSWRLDRRSAGLHGIDVDGIGIGRISPRHILDTSAPSRPSRPAHPAAPADSTLSWRLISTGIPDEGDLPTEVAFTSDGAGILVAHRMSRNITVFDAETRDVLQTIPLSGGPNSLAVSADGLHAVTANVFENTISIVDLASGMESATVAVGDLPAIVQVTPDGLTAVVGNVASQDLSVVDIASATERWRIPNASFSPIGSVVLQTGDATFEVRRFAITADSQTAIIPDMWGNRIQFFNLVTGTVTFVPSHPYPRTIDITPDGTIAAVGHPVTSVVSVLDVPNRTILRTISIGVDVQSTNIAIDHTGTKAVVPVIAGARIVNLVSSTVSPDLATGWGYDLDLTTTADGDHCFAGGPYGCLISYVSESIVACESDPVRAYTAAVSPVSPRAALISHISDELLHVFNTDGAAAHLEESVLSGPPPEGDRPRSVAVTPDGRTAVAVNMLSDNVTIVDLVTGTVDAIVPVGIHPSEVEITPDGLTAVVANLKDSFVSVIDLQTHEVNEVGISLVGGRVEISPDGRYAYVAVCSYGDGVWRIDLPALSVDGGKVPTGNMGGISYLFLPTSGMTLSHDGATLVTCNTYSDDISIIDTIQWVEVARVPVGEEPSLAVFTPDDSMIYVSNMVSGTIDEVINSGSGSSVSRTFSVAPWPCEMAVSPDAMQLHVAHQDFSADHGRITIIDLAPARTPTTELVLDEPVVGLHLDATGERLYAATGRSQTIFGGSNGWELNRTGGLYVIEMPAGVMVDSVDTGQPPARLCVNEASQLAVIASPVAEGIVVIEIGGSTAVVDRQDVASPVVRTLLGAPNPLASGTRILFSLAGPSPIRLGMYDSQGRLVRRLLNAAFGAGEHSAAWDGRDQAGSPVPRGVYFARLESSGGTRSCKVIVKR